MKNLWITVVVLLVSLLTIISCSKTELLTPVEHINEPIQVIDGRLVFESEKIFSNTVKDLMKRQDNLDTWKEQFNYTSLWEAYEALTAQEKEQISTSKSVKGFEDVVKLYQAEDGELEAIPTISSNIFEMLYNHQGVLQIGSKLYKQDYDYLKIITDGDISKLEMLKDIHTTDEKLGIEVHRITRNIEEKGTYGFDHMCLNNWGSKKRLRGMTSYDCNGIWTSLNASTRYFKKSWGVFWLKKADFIELQVDAEYTVYEKNLLGVYIPFEETVDYNNLRRNDSKMVYTFVYYDVFDVDAYVDTEIMDGLHKVKPYGSSFKECATNY